MITVTRDALYEPLISNIAGRSVHTYPIKVTVTANAPEAMSHKVFVYHAKNKGEASDDDLFEAVASVHQLMEIPPDKPVYDPENAAAYIPYYRTNVMHFHCRSEDEASELWDKVKEDIDDLVMNFSAAAALRAAETVTYTTT